MASYCMHSRGWNLYQGAHAFACTTPCCPLWLHLLPLSHLLLPHQPCCLCAVSNSPIHLCPRTFALTISDSWNTSPHSTPLPRHLHDLILYFSQVSGNVTLSARPYLRAAGFNSTPLPPLCASLSDVIDSFVNICLSLLGWGFLFV